MAGKKERGKMFAKGEFSVTDDTRFSTRRARTERFQAAVLAARERLGIRPDVNHYVPVKTTVEGR